ncbi:hypothetical protein TNCV_710761 [Trichonephila clavipes]|nr:hypothetical protein TNCV_710761 [Trichonephila clavipes]
MVDILPWTTALPLKNLRVRPLPRVVGVVKLQSNPFEHDNTPNGGEVRSEINGSTRNGRRASNSPPTKGLAQTVAEARNEGAACVWIADNETVGTMCGYRMIWWSSLLLVYRGPHEPSHHVIDFCLVHWS